MDPSQDPEKLAVDNTTDSDTSPGSSISPPPELNAGAVNPSADANEAAKIAAPQSPAAGPGQEQDPIPDGGLEAWLQVLGAWVLMVDTWGLVGSFGVYQTYYETTMMPSTSPSAISWIGSLQAALLMLVGVVSGPLFDMGYFRALITSGVAFIVLGQFMLSLCSTYWQVLLAQGITTGLGMGLSFLPCMAVLSQYFRRKRALVLGLSSTGSPIGGIVIPIIFSHLRSRLGFGWATRVLAFILLAISVVPVVCMRTRLAPSSSRRQFIDPTALRDAPFVTHVLGAFFAFATIYVPFFYLQLFAQRQGLAGTDVSPYVVTMLNAGSILGRILPNYVADYVGSLNVVTACAAASAVLLFGWFGVRDLAGLAVFAVIYGAISGGIVSVTPSVLITLTPNPGRIGARMGMAFTITGVALLVGTPIAGAVVADFSEERWKGVMGYTAGGVLVATALYSTCRLMLYRSRGGLKA